MIPYFSFRMLFFYAAGAYLALRRPALVAFQPKRSVRICCACLLPLVAVLHAFVPSESYNLVMILLLWLAINPDAVRPHFAYSATFFVYLSHSLLLSVLKKIALALLPHTQSAAICTYLLIPLVAMPLLIAAAWLLRRLLPKTSALLTGGRGDRPCKMPQRAALP